MQYTAVARNSISYVITIITTLYIVPEWGNSYHLSELTPSEAIIQLRNVKSPWLRGKECWDVGSSCMVELRVEELLAVCIQLELCFKSHYWLKVSNYKFFFQSLHALKCIWRACILSLHCIRPAIVRNSCHTEWCHDILAARNSCHDATLNGIIPTFLQRETLAIYTAWMMPHWMTTILHQASIPRMIIKNNCE